MLFNSLSFIFIFMPLVVWISLRLRGQNLLRLVTLSSFVFYGLAGHAWFLIPMLVTTILDFYLAPLIHGAPGPRKKPLLLLSLCGNLGLLFYFKYSGLVAQTVRGALHLWAPAPAAAGPQWLSLFEVALPAGISFYTFQTMAYVIDVYRGHAEPELNFWKFAGFVSFFPHLVAGPLTRHNQLIPGLTHIAEYGVEPLWREGIYLFCIGLSKKIIIADKIASHVVDPILNGHAPGSFCYAWLALLGYGLQIYFDFSGYSDMAIGLARLFGIQLPVNFNSPYQAVNPSDFWRRWHITLSLWLRDYLYFTLGGNRCSAARRNFNLMATMVLGGLWHGANWTFAMWGFYHGLLLVAHHRYEETWSRWPHAIQRTVTFLAVTLGWVFFRASSFGEASAWFKQLAGLGAFSGIWHLQRDHVLLVLAGLILAQFFPNAVSFKGYARLSPGAQIALGATTAVSILMLGNSSRFLYFQF